MKNEYVIISKTATEKRIEKLKKDLKDEPNPFLNTSYQTELDTLKHILFQSIPLIPEIENAFDEGSSYLDITLPIECKQDYISNLKLNI
jgi:hypothetical protein